MTLPTDLARLRENDPAVAARLAPDTLRLLAERRSTKIAELRGPGPSADEVNEILRIAARVPDHGKLCPWRVMVFEGEGRARAGAKLAEIVAADRGGASELVGAEHERFLRAPVVLMVVSTAAPHPKIPEWEQLLAVGGFCFNLVLSAHAAGYAGCWLTEWPTYDERARTALGLAAHERVAGFIYLGTAGDAVVERARGALRVERF